MANFAVDLNTLTSQLQNTSIPKECGVSFAGKGLKLNDAKDAQTIVDEIKKCETVEYLNMEGNSLGVDAAKEIAKALENRKEFKKALWKDMFTSRLKTEIPIALKHLTGSLMLAGARIQVLDLSDNASGPIGVEGFEEFLRSSSCYSLRELRLNNMGLGIAGAKKLASALLDLYNNSKNAGEPLKLEVFVAGRNRLENPGATALAQVFQKIGSLREISIPQNGIYHAGVSALSAAFNENLSLEVINLNDNTVTEKGARALSEVLHKLSNLKSLDLGDCLLRSNGATLVAQSLSSLANLESINLSFNEVRGGAGSIVLESLASLSPHLTSLNLDGNMFGPTMATELESMADQLQLPLASLGEDEGEDEDVDKDDEDENDDEDDEDDDEDDYSEDEEDKQDTESDQLDNIDVKHGGHVSSAKRQESCDETRIQSVTSLLESLTMNGNRELVNEDSSQHFSQDKSIKNKNEDGLNSPLVNGNFQNTVEEECDLHSSYGIDAVNTSPCSHTQNDKADLISPLHGGVTRGSELHTPSLVIINDSEAQACQPINNGFEEKSELLIKSPCHNEANDVLTAVGLKIVSVSDENTKNLTDETSIYCASDSNINSFSNETIQVCDIIKTTNCDSNNVSINDLCTVVNDLGAHGPTRDSGILSLGETLPQEVSSTFSTLENSHSPDGTEIPSSGVKTSSSFSIDVQDMAVDLTGHNLSDHDQELNRAITESLGIKDSDVHPLITCHNLETAAKKEAGFTQCVPDTVDNVAPVPSMEKNDNNTERSVESNGKSCTIL